ncbi:hypothetical protein LN650_23685 [Klebsiella pneumoniae subsp. pneumoniae]|nr:hypothetical protein [Klebsiella pneumoniae subsp. pneumoniae]
MPPLSAWISTLRDEILPERLANRAGDDTASLPSLLAMVNPGAEDERQPGWEMVSIAGD